MEAVDNGTTGKDNEVDSDGLRTLIDDLAAGRVSADDVVGRLRRQPFTDLGYARVDHHRALRQGMPEAIYAPGKTPEQCAGIVSELLNDPAGGPVLLTRAIKDALVNVTCGGAPAYVWPGGGITVMVDVMRMPNNSFGTVPTPAIVAPIEFSMTLAHYRALGGHMGQVRTLQEVLSRGAGHSDGAPRQLQWQSMHAANPWPLDL